MALTGLTCKIPSIRSAIRASAHLRVQTRPSTSGQGTKIYPECCESKYLPRLPGCCLLSSNFLTVTWIRQTNSTFHWASLYQPSNRVHGQPERHILALVANYQLQTSLDRKVANQHVQELQQGHLCLLLPLRTLFQ